MWVFFALLDPYPIQSGSKTLVVDIDPVIQDPDSILKKWIKDIKDQSEKSDWIPIKLLLSLMSCSGDPPAMAGSGYRSLQVPYFTVFSDKICLFFFFPKTRDCLVTHTLLAKKKIKVCWIEQKEVVSNICSVVEPEPEP